MVHGQSKNIKRIRATMDIEAKDWSKLTLIGFYDGVTYRHFYQMSKFIDFIKDKNYEIYAHNLDYDGKFVIQHLMDHKDVIIPVMLINGQLTHFPYKNNVFKCSLKLLPASLDKLTHDFNVQHKKLKTTDMAHDIEYNKYDCMGLYEVLQKFEEQVGQLKMTVASTSLNYFKRSTNPKFKTNKHIDDKVRQAYCGGRTEIFRFNNLEEKDKKFYYYDINSLYPYIMTQLKYPVGRLKKTNNIEEEGICKVTMRENTFFPLVPSKERNKLFFRNGEKTIWTTTLEAREAIKQGAKVQVFEAWTTDHTKYLFKDYIKDLYNQRLKAKANNETAKQYIIKILMNSLYGKFAQKRELNAYFLDSELYKYNKNMALYMSPSNSKGWFIDPILSAYTTAGARILMQKLLNSVNDPNKVYYMDTDSIILESKSFNNSKDLGKFKLENIILDFIPILPKLYYFRIDESIHLKAKGIPHKILTPKIFTEYIKGKQVGHQAGLMGIRSALKRGNKEIVQLKEIKRSLQTYYDKRMIKQDLETVAIEDYSDTYNNEFLFNGYLNAVISFLPSSRMIA